MMTGEGRNAPGGLGGSQPHASLITVLTETCRAGWNGWTRWLADQQRAWGCSRTLGAVPARLLGLLYELRR